MRNIFKILIEGINCFHLSKKHLKVNYAKTSFSLLNKVTTKGQVDSCAELSRTTQDMWL